jgi:hypothetical protein
MVAAEGVGGMTLVGYVQDEQEIMFRERKGENPQSSYKISLRRKLACHK